jgi:alpha-glucosidase (family GH31 glycosyl hydrolase)
LKTLVQYIGTTKLKPRFALGYHQGCYGYESLKGSPYGKDLLTVAKKHRENGIPLDGIHVDVDIQKNYCTFTMDESKFPSDTFNQLEDLGIKCSTNITPVNSYLNNDYQTYKSGKLNDFFIHDKSDKPYYKGGVYYGNDYGTLGHYSDFGNKDVRAWWGQQYKLLYERGLKMVWQDMTSPDIPDHIGLANNTIKGPDGTCYRIGDVIESGWRSLPLELKLTDNFYKRYNGEASNACDGADMLNYEGRIRNLYSYNLHKATYHGLDNIWFINLYTFLDIDGVDKVESKSILDELISKNVVYLADDGSGGFEKYLLNDNWQSNIGKCNLSKKSEVSRILQQAQNLRKLRENKRNYIIGRGGFTGMHRFAGLWTGDNASTWDFLRINIAQSLASGITGQSMTGADIGGFEQNGDDKWADPQLLMRWTLLGSFVGWFRNHYNGKASKKWFQEPYQYGQDWVLNMVSWNEHHLYKAVLPVCRRYIHVRYQLMQLLYDAMFENTITGMPIARALFLTMKDAALFNDKLDFINNEFTIGNDLLVAPVLTQQKTDTDGIRDVYLPYISDDYYGNRWYCYQHNRYKLEKAISGGTTISYDASFKYSWGQTNPDDDKHLLGRVGRP